MKHKKHCREYGAVRPVGPIFQARAIRFLPSLLTLRWPINEQGNKTPCLITVPAARHVFYGFAVVHPRPTARTRQPADASHPAKFHPSPFVFQTRSICFALIPLALSCCFDESQNFYPQYLQRLAIFSPFFFASNAPACAKGVGGLNPRPAVKRENALRLPFYL